MGNSRDIKKEQARIHREFKYLKTVDNIQSEYALAQAKEICGYFNRLTLTPFPAWESFLLINVERDLEEFLYKFYLIKNEFGVLEPDFKRINEL